MTSMRPRKWGPSVVARVVGAGAEPEEVVVPRSAERGKTNVVMISRGGKALYEPRNKRRKSVYVAECGTPCIIKCDRKAHARQIWQDLVSIKISVDRA